MKRPPDTSAQQPCPCGSNLRLADCCGAVIAGRRAADTAVALMRSRYTAYVLGDTDYLQRSWHPGTRPARLALDNEPKWLGLRILAVEAGGPGDGTGSVEFVARYKVGGRARRLHEISRFERQDGCWYYVDGTTDGGS
jgi:SEC-C motif-containing protein